MQFRDEIVERLRRWAEGTPAPPLRLILYLTNRCNLDCLFCDVPRDLKSGVVGEEKELTYFQWERIVQEGIKLGVREWWFPGLGETMFHPVRTLQLLKLIKTESPDSYCHLTTNGTFFTEDVCRAIVELGVDHINFSIDAPSAEIHDTLRNTPGTFDRATRALNTLSQLKKERGTDKPELCITTVLTSINYSSLSSMIPLAASVGARGITVNPLRITHENEERIAQEELQVSAEHEPEVRKILTQCAEEASKAGIRFELNGWNDLEMGPRSGQKHAEGFAAPDEGKSDGFFKAACFEPFYTMGIDAHGNVSYCASSGGTGTDEHNAVDSGLAGTWHGPVMAQARKRMLSHTPYYNCFGCGIKAMRQVLMNELVED